MSFISKTIKTGLVGGTLAAGIFVANRHLNKRYTSVNKTFEYKGFSWSYPHGRINYIKRGERKPLLLIHGLSVYNSCYDFSRVIDRLAEKRTVYAIDLLGCGHSDKPEITYTAFTFVQIIYMFINEVIGENVDIIASGLSGAYAVTAKSGFCDKIDKIIMTDPVSLSALSVAPTKRDSVKKDLGNLPLSGSLLYNLYSSETGSRAYTDALFSGSEGNVSRETSEAFCESAHIGGSGGKYLFNSIRNRFVCVDIRRFLKDIEGLSVIYGSLQENGQQLASRYRKINKNIEIYEIPGTGRMACYQSPAEFLTIVGGIL